MTRSTAVLLLLGVLAGASVTACTSGHETRTDTFDTLDGWSVYDGPGHAGRGTRGRAAVRVADGILTISGDAHGNTGGLRWNGRSQRYGQWDVRLRAPAGCACYHPVVLLWGTGGGSGVDNPNGEIDIVESIARPDRDENSFSVHYGGGGPFVGASVPVDMTRWHVYHVLWRADLITTWIDDDPAYFTTDDPAVMPTGPVDVAIQLDWFPDDPRDGGSTAIMEVDWITQRPIDELPP